MREQTRDIDRLQHIAECIACINEYLSGYTYEEMKADKKCFHAVVYNLMIMGEAANLLTKEFRSEHTEVPWRVIVDMRNLLIHGYITTDAIYVWDTYKNDLPTLNEKVADYIKELSCDITPSNNRE